MGILGKIFGSSGAVEEGMSLIDKAFYTKEERAEDNLKLIDAKINYMKAHAPFKIAQRWFMMAMVLNFTLAFLIGLGVVVHNMIWAEHIIAMKPLIELVKAFGLFEIVGGIGIFYFGGGALDSVKRMKRSK